MLAWIKAYLARKRAEVEQQRIEREKAAHIEALETYRDFRDCNAPIVMASYTFIPPPEAELQQMHSQDVSMLRQRIPAGVLVGDHIQMEVEAKIRAQSTEGRYEILLTHSGRTSFQYYADKKSMSESERMLAAYAEIALEYGFIEPIIERGMCWVAINRTVNEYVSQFALRRLSAGTAYAYEDTTEISGIFAFGDKVGKSVPTTWRVLLNQLKEKESVAEPVARRLISEITLAGWARSNI